MNTSDNAKPGEVELHIQDGNKKAGQETKSYDFVDNENPQESWKRKYRDMPKGYAPIPKKLIILCSFMLIVGVAFFISGMVDYFEGERSRGIGFLVFGCLLLIPGFYYTYQLFEACRAGSPEERQEILNDIPIDL